MVGLNNIIESEERMDYPEYMLDSLWQSEYPYEEIFESLKQQFINYMHLQDNTNYIEIFHQAYGDTAECITHEYVTQKDLIRENLEELKYQFLDLIVSLFRERLAINLDNLTDDAGYIDDDVMLIIQCLYELFILSARSNFKFLMTSLTLSLRKPYDPLRNYSEYTPLVEEVIMRNSPLIIDATPDDFIRILKLDWLRELYEAGSISGNFLRKYTPKFYQNEEYKIEVINHIITSFAFRDFIENPDQQQEDPTEDRVNVGEGFSEPIKTFQDFIEDGI